MAFVAHVLRLGVVVQGIFWNLLRCPEEVQLRASVRAMATHARHLATVQGIVATAHGMPQVRMSHAVVGSEFDRRHVTRGHTLFRAQVTRQTKLIHL